MNDAFYIAAALTLCIFFVYINYRREEDFPSEEYIRYKYSAWAVLILLCMVLPVASHCGIPTHRLAEILFLGLAFAAYLYRKAALDLVDYLRRKKMREYRGKALWAHRFGAWGALFLIIILIGMAMASFIMTMA